MQCPLLLMQEFPLKAVLRVGGPLQPTRLPAPRLAVGAFVVFWGLDFLLAEEK